MINLKKILSGIMAVCLMGNAVVIPESITPEIFVTASAEGEKEYKEGTYEQFIYKNYGDYIEIVYCERSAIEVVIPPEIENVPVTSIGDNSFQNCYNLTSINIPDSVTSIGNDAFAFCDNLISINIPDSMISIGKNAFCFCDNLTSVNISASVTSIGKWAFFECEKLNELTILNPYCEIYDSSETICNEDYYNYGFGSYNQYFTGTIYGYENSTAQAYAEKYGKNFESLGQPPEKVTESGDINGDNLINAIDSTIVLVEYAELSTTNTSTLTGSQKKSADVNNDGAINAIDATIISQYYAHISTGGTMKFSEFIEIISSET